MRIDSLLNQVSHSNTLKKTDLHAEQKGSYSSVLKTREAGTSNLEAPNASSRSIIQDFAEWYLKQGHTHESQKSYKMAISAYEKANSVEPDLKNSESVDSARKKAYKG